MIVTVTPVQAVSVTVTPLGEGAATIFPPVQAVTLSATVGTVPGPG